MKEEKGRVFTQKTRPSPLFIYPHTKNSCNLAWVVCSFILKFSLLFAFLILRSRQRVCSGDEHSRVGASLSHTSFLRVTHRQSEICLFIFQESHPTWFISVSLTDRCGLCMLKQANMIHISKWHMKGRIVEPEGKAVAMQWLDKYVFRPMNTQSNTGEIVRSGVLYMNLRILMR